jgi:hypothetical protein
MEENMTKERLIQEIHSTRMRLEKTLEKVSEQQMVTPGVMDDWTVKDFLAHIAVWE